MAEDVIDGRALHALVTAAFETARRASNNEAQSPQKLHALRSKAWVEGLAEAFRSHYNELDPAVRVFSKYCRDNRADFTLNELLFDICVCRTATVPPVRGGADLRYVSEPLWQIESEFACDSKQALADFNKLVLGSAADKLFIGPCVSKQDEFRQVLISPARCCTGRVWLAIVPHPSEWGQSSITPSVFQFKDD